MKKLELLFLSMILLGALMVRLYRFNSPIADWHSWRQSDTSAVSRNFVEHGFDLLHPRYDDISNVQTGKDNPQGYRFVEFPLYNVFQAGGFILFDHFTLEEWGRIVTIIISLISIVFIYLIGKRYANGTVGLSAGAFFAFIPYNIYYDRTILPDPAMTMSILGGIYFFGKWIKETGKKKIKIPLYGLWFTLAIIFTSASLLFKPFALFYALVFLYLAWIRFHWKLFLRIDLWLILIFSVFPLLLWRLWMTQYPQGVPSNTWLFNGGHIRFTGAYFYWIFIVRLGSLILGSWGLVIVLMGLLKVVRRDMKVFYAFGISTLTYLIVIARGNVQHDYYQIIIIPSLAFFFGLGVDYILSAEYKYLTNKIISIGFIVVCSVFMGLSTWYQIRDYFNINNPSLIIAGAAVDRLTPKDAKVIAPLDGDTTFLYQTKRKGWPSFEHGLSDLIQLGADYLVLVNPKPADYNIGKTYKIVSATSDYILFDLHKNP